MQPRVKRVQNQSASKYRLYNTMAVETMSNQASHPAAMDWAGDVKSTTALSSMAWVLSRENYRY